MLGRKINWECKKISGSHPDIYVEKGSTTVRFSTKVLNNSVVLHVVDEKPSYALLENELLLSKTDCIQELTTPPLIALYRAIKGYGGNLEIRERSQFMADLKEMVELS